MKIKLYMIGEFFMIESPEEAIEQVREVGEEALLKIVEAAKNKDMACLSFVAPDTDTFFYTEQLREVQKEIEVLKSDPELDIETLNIIEKALQEPLKEGFTYLRFSHRDLLKKDRVINDFESKATA